MTDWKAIEVAAADQLVSAVRAVREQHPDEGVYGAIFHEFYGDGTMMSWPMVTVGTEESLARVIAGYADVDSSTVDWAVELRWSGPDLEYSSDPGDAEHALADAVQSEVGESGFAAWERAYDRFMRCFPKAAKSACRKLLAEGLVGKEFVAIAADEVGELVPLSLTKAQIRKHFPQYDAAERERQRLLALPAAERVAEVLPHALGLRYDGLLDGDEYDRQLRDCGEAALTALVRVVRGEELPDGTTGAAMALAEINVDTPEVVDALESLMRDADADENARAWAASALARMDRSDLVLAQLDTLPPAISVRGLCDPLRAFRDNGAHRALDYAPIERALGARPDLEPEFEQELRPGVSYCEITRDEIPIAQAALSSRWNAIRTHARIVLEEAQ